MQKLLIAKVFVDEAGTVPPPSHLFMMRQLCSSDDDDHRPGWHSFLIAHEGALHDCEMVVHDILVRHRLHLRFCKGPLEA